MNQKLILEIGSRQRLEILNEIKRGEGLAVPELAKRLKMSYMGIKRHCLALHQSGYLETWRRPRAARGRPQLEYRLTRKAQDLFPVSSNQLSLDLLKVAAEIYGVSAAEKLLYSLWMRKADQYRGRIKGKTAMDKAKWLVRLRDHDGWMSELRQDDEGWLVYEGHSPILDLLDRFPNLGRFEKELYERALGVAVSRREERVAGLYSCRVRLLQPPSKGGAA